MKGNLMKIAKAMLFVIAVGFFLMVNFLLLYPVFTDSGRLERLGTGLRENFLSISLVLSFTFSTIWWAKLYTELHKKYKFLVESFEQLKKRSFTRIQGLKEKILDLESVIRRQEKKIIALEQELSAWKQARLSKLFKKTEMGSTEMGEKESTNIIPLDITQSEQPLKKAATA